MLSHSKAETTVLIRASLSSGGKFGMLPRRLDDRESGGDHWPTERTLMFRLFTDERRHMWPLISEHLGHP